MLEPAASNVADVTAFGPSGSLILRRIKSPLLFNIAITFLICLLHAAVTVTGRVWPTVIPLPHTLLSSALGLLLVFRTNAAYDRFWEARKQWGIVTTECRALASLACTYMTPQQALTLTLTLALALTPQQASRPRSASQT